MGAVAVNACKEIGYSSAGTFEFLLGPDGEPSFIEVNCRLQVEHPVTEMVTGIDLVQLQIRIGRGESIAGLEPVVRGAAIEARVCAEDPAAGFLPSPGRVARFDPSLGPRVRVDSGVVAGNVIPGAFDSLIAKVIAGGETRDEARARLVAALADFDLVIAGGATNKGYLIELLETPDLRAGGVDTGWLDRRPADAQGVEATYAAESLVAAAILAYQRRRREARLNFFATGDVASARAPHSTGQRIELSHGGSTYRLDVFALGSWRYRVRENGRSANVTLREGDPHVALLGIGERTLRVLHDASDAGVRIEVEGRPHRFGWQTAGQVRAATPAVVVAVHVAPGDTVVAGQALGLLEAMKMEIAFRAPVGGVVSEVCVRAGQQVAAGRVLLAIDAAAESAEAAQARLQLPEKGDPLDPLGAADASLDDVDLALLDACDPALRAAALEALRHEVRAVLLGYDVEPERAERLLAFLRARLPRRLSRELRRELAAVASEVTLFADVEQPFLRAPHAGADGGRTTPSNLAQLRRWVRGLRAGGAGLAPEFLERLRTALAHYGVRDLTHDDALERAVLRLFASREAETPRRRLVTALLSRLSDLARSGVSLEDNVDLASALERVVDLRDLVGDGLADAAIEARYVICEEPAVAREVKRTRGRIGAVLRAPATAGARTDLFANDFLLGLAEAPRAVFERAGVLLASSDPRRRAMALAACLHRASAPGIAEISAVDVEGDLTAALAVRADGRRVLGCAAGSADVAAVAARIADHAAGGSLGAPVDAVEVFVAGDPARGDPGLADGITRALAVSAFASPVAPHCLTVSWIRGGSDRHWTFRRDGDGCGLDAGLHEIHPDTARRIGLDRLLDFELERLPGADRVYCFHGRSRVVRGDERVFVLAEVRGASGAEAAEQVGAFDRTFQAATRALRNALAARDPERRLQWNRIAIAVIPEVRIAAKAIDEVARRLAPATHRLGIERVVVRLPWVDPETPDATACETELVVTNVTGRHVEVAVREPRRDPLTQVTAYERRVVEARRRRLVYPYEILRLLTGGRAGARDPEDGAELPPSTFEEYDLAPGASPPRALRVAGRPPGENASGIVFGVIRTATDKVPEGMRRVLVLADPTAGMGSLAGPECDRICAAIDLAERCGLPVEWVPISSGARIAMDSGTENLDATARVARRIVSFTQAGGVIHLVVYGTNVGAQSYWNALATMLLHTRGALVMTPDAAMVLTGRRALEASGGVAAEDEVGIGGFERIMGANGEAQYFARDLPEAYRLLYEHHRFTYVVPGEGAPRRHRTRDPSTRDVTDAPYGIEGHGFQTVGEIFDDAVNPGRKRPFAMRALMGAVVDRDGGHLERWGSWIGAETAIVWDAHVGGVPVCLIGIESQSVARDGDRPPDGPTEWNGGTLFPLSSKKVARALNAASGVRPVVVLANLSGFDGSPESMRKLQLEHGAEIARAVVNFAGPILFLVVSRYHGGAYVVFSKELNDGLRAAALEGSYASVIGGNAAASVVFTREVRARAVADARVRAAQASVDACATRENRETHDRALEEALLEARAALAAEFDAVHSVERARAVGSLDDVVAPADMRAYLIDCLLGEDRIRSVG